MAERVMTRVQGEGESICDFIYMYRSLCQIWKPDIQKAAVLKPIFRNVNPHMASQLRVATVDKLVRLGQQLEKDKASQCQYELWKKQGVKHKEKEKLHLLIPDSPPQKSNTTPVVYCWRCQGSHAPYSCPNFNQSGKFHPQQPCPQPSYPSHDQQYHPQPSHSVSEHNCPTVNTLQCDQHHVLPPIPLCWV